jgi:putative FmdB family regulatory protein
VPTYQYHCNECGKSFERTETITEHEAAKMKCPKCNCKKSDPSSGSRSRRDIQEELEPLSHAAPPQSRRCLFSSFPSSHRKRALLHRRQSQARRSACAA